MVFFADHPGPEVGTGYLSHCCNSNHNQCNHYQCWVKEIQNIYLQSCNCKKYRCENSKCNTFQFLKYLLGNPAHHSEKNTHYKRTKNCLKIQCLGDSTP